MSAQECKIAFRVNFRHFMRELYGTVVLAENICGVCNWISGELFPTPGMVGGGLRLRGGGAGDRKREKLNENEGCPHIACVHPFGFGRGSFLRYQRPTTTTHTHISQCTEWVCGCVCGVLWRGKWSGGDSVWMGEKTTCACRECVKMNVVIQ